LKSYSAQLGEIGQSGKKAELHRDTDLEVYGNNLPPKTFVLTFDDGPHARYTDRILDVLQKHGVKSIFFQLGENLGSLKQNKVVPTRASAASKRSAGKWRDHCQPWLFAQCAAEDERQRSGPGIR
jgi:peptidoglycan/xylan/chitin deacetylase (PgdA/CDA1 family)